MVEKPYTLVTIIPAAFYKKVGAVEGEGWGGGGGLLSFLITIFCN